MAEDEDDGPMIKGDSGTELSSNRTALAFARTEMATDRTLMAFVRTALSLISFGFTIYSFFHSPAHKFASDPLPDAAPARFALMLVAMGILLLFLGILNHWRLVLKMRRRRDRLYSLDLVHNLSQFSVSSVTLIAVLLLVVGVLVILRVGFGTGPL